MPMRFALPLCCLFSLACTSPTPNVAVIHVDGGPTADAGTPPAPDAGSCVATGERCSGEGNCCDGYCPHNGYAYSYSGDSGRCTAKEADGAYCMDASWCVSGVCSDSVCGIPQCVATSETCIPGQSKCCDGYCEWTGYISGTCRAFIAAGEPCGVSEQCSTSLCSDGACRYATCMNAGDACQSDATCCNGYCTADFTSYLPGHCAARLASQSYCVRNESCQSQSCLNGICQ